MATGRYLATVLAITVLAVIAGIFLWNSETSQVLSDDGNTICDGWCLGPEDAALIIETFPDFT
ncbi:MAG: hypothetical protein PHV74_02690 [Dehalococcoidia bacterium]|nr:hypothetical protein [Dehalococcoidia bacterium]